LNEDDVIKVDVPDKKFRELLEKQINYSIISLPFTVNRMDIDNITQRIKNTAKGKLAEALFSYYCEENNIDINTKNCQTPFYTVDRHDFIYDGYEWDIKNNFIYHRGDELSTVKYVDLPALVPDRYSGDQWSKRIDTLHTSTKGTRFLFSFMKQADLINGKRKNYFFDLKINKKQKTHLSRMCNDYQGDTKDDQPFPKLKFWGKWDKLGNGKRFDLKLRYHPNMYITGWAGKNHWDLFSTIKDKNYHDGVFYAKIENKECKVKNLPSFKSLIY